jgi:hypothetical protein
VTLTDARGGRTPVPSPASRLFRSGCTDCLRTLRTPAVNSWNEYDGSRIWDRRREKLGLAANAFRNMHRVTELLLTFRLSLH